MELDEIKKTWSEVDLLKEKQQLNDNNIKEMLENKGKSALAKLIKRARFQVIVTIPLGLLFCLASRDFFKAGGYYIICPLVVLFLCFLLEPFRIHLYRLLKEIDFSTMTVKEVSERILKYQNILQKFKICGMIFFAVFGGIWLYLSCKLSFGSEVTGWLINYIIAIAILYLIGLIAMLFFYKKRYINNINRIKESLKELKEFEES